MRKTTFLLLSIFTFINLFAQAELPMDLPQMMGEISEPQPQGIVDENPVWLHVKVPLSADGATNSQRRADKARLQFQRRFYFKLSKNTSFTGDDVYESGPKRYSFYSPYEHLSVGKWYWKYGVADPDTPDSPVWNSQVYSFEITGNERLTPIPPRPEEVLNSAISRPNPVTVLFKEEFGKLLPTQKWPQLASFILTKVDQNFNKNTPMTYTVSDQDAINAGYVDENGNANAEELFFRKLINTRYGQKNRYLKELMSGYLLTGRTEIRDMIVQKANELIDFYNTGEFYIGSIGKTMTVRDNTWGGNNPKGDFLELITEALTEEEKKEFVEDAYPLTRTSPEVAEKAEHALYSQHLWQEIADVILTPMIYARYSAQAREEFYYAYELWLYRAPSLSRTDGGSQEGDGYLGVHDDYLSFIPWLLYKLTGHNYYKGHPWFQNIGKYLQYTNAFGTLPNSFCDGDSPATTMPYTMETMAYLDPDNYWSKYRFSQLPQQDFKKAAADLGKKRMGMGRLSMWNYFDESDLSNVKPPTTLAAAFRDIGEVAMNTDFINKEKNLHVTFHSSPYGSAQHTHPAQNAFNLSYGGQDMFWKVGFYNGGGPHNVLNYKNSRAHNTIMADSLVQGFHHSAYGWITRFATGNKISYALGDASNAYNGKHWLANGKPGNTDADGNHIFKPTPDPDTHISHTREFGFGDPGVTRFRRHLAMLRPNYVLIYDELEAENPITWQFNIHSRRFMKKLGDNWLMATNDYGSASVKLFCNSPTITTLDSEWLPSYRESNFIKPENNRQWLLKPWDDENKLPKPIPDHYHGTIGTSEKHSKMRFLTLIEMHPDETSTYLPTEPQSTTNGAGLTVIQAGEYTIKVQLDATEKSFLSVVNANGSAALLTGQDAKAFWVKGKQYRTQYRGATLLIEDGEIEIEEVDKYPDALIYGNKY
ncbi:DUF4962 domain-containing protein [Tamlana fucoidanivorans]|uniref:DUF4962 domain-containing protein n=1 Tax=Allotamlana fucoidanivorans TaxID=2583814 RepID=A0A5C4SPV5_9FLAO|nr:DUF4962 domain-containing protein [Tamlana fucoidanivorans]TNJ46013.1 DUF4962 domain-containing protein [Tamlana fucoidanivorans]